MKNKNNLIIILFASLGVILILYFSFGSKSKKRFQWKEHYHATSDQPYGTLFIQKLLASTREESKFKLNKEKPLHILLDTIAGTSSKTDYVFIGQDIYLDKEDKKALLNFISSGNDAFIASVNLPFGLLDEIFIMECDQEMFLIQNEQLKANLNFYNTHLKTKKGYNYKYRFGKDDKSYFWNVLNPDLFCDSASSITPLGYITPDKVNFFRLTHGKGHLYIHTNPLVFTNYFLTKIDKSDYAASVFSHLDGENIIWDEFSKSQFISQNNAPDVSPLSYILQQESLKYAWWLMLAGALLYALFTAKRKQRIIPVLEEKSNTSLEFVNMISALHFQNGNHSDIARKKMKYFLYFIRARYGIHSQHLTEAHIKRLAEKSKVDPENLRIIFSEFKYIEQPLYGESRLIGLYNALEKFYYQCK